MKGKNLIFHSNGKRWMSESMAPAFAEKIRSIYDKFVHDYNNESFTERPVTSSEENLAQKYIYAIYVTQTGKDSRKNTYCCSVTETHEDAITRFNKEKERINQSFENLMIHPLSNVLDLCNARVLILSYDQGFITLSMVRIPCNEISEDYIINSDPSIGFSYED